jgi:hypothetical protein
MLAPPFASFTSVDQSINDASDPFQIEDRRYGGGFTACWLLVLSVDNSTKPHNPSSPLSLFFWMTVPVSLARFAPLQVGFGKFPAL